MLGSGEENHFDIYGRFVCSGHLKVDRRAWFVQLRCNETPGDRGIYRIVNLASHRCACSLLLDYVHCQEPGLGFKGVAVDLSIGVKSLRS